MAQFSPTAMAEAVSNFLLIARKQEEHSRLAERFEEEISSLRDTIADLQHRLAIQEGRSASDNSAAVKRHEEDIKGLQDTFDSEQCRFDKIAARISKIEADNTKLLEENTDIFAELRHIESLLMIAGMSRLSLYAGLPDPTDDGSRSRTCPTSRRAFSSPGLTATRHKARRAAATSTPKPETPGRL